MKIQEVQNNEQTIVSLSGLLDSSSSPEFQDVVNRLLQQAQPNLIVDLEQLDYTSSQGIRTFLTLIKKVSEKQGTLVFRNIKPAVRDVFDLSGISQLMRIE